MNLHHIVKEPISNKLDANSSDTTNSILNNTDNNIGVSSFNKDINNKYSGENTVMCPLCGFKFDEKLKKCPSCKNIVKTSGSVTNKIEIPNNLKTKTPSSPVKQSFKSETTTKEEKVSVNTETDESKSLLKQFFYYKTDDRYRLSKTKVISLLLFCILDFIFIPVFYDGSNLIYSFIMGSLTSLVFTFPIFLLGMGLHFWRGETSNGRKTFKHYLFYYHDEEIRLSKTKVISWTVFFIFGLIITITGINDNGFDLFTPIIYFFAGGLIFGIPTFIVGYLIHYLSRNK